MEATTRMNICMTPEEMLVARLRGDFFITIGNIDDVIRRLIADGYISDFGVGITGGHTIYKNFTVIDGYLGERTYKFESGSAIGVDYLHSKATNNWLLYATDLGK